MSQKSDHIGLSLWALLILFFIPLCGMTQDEEEPKFTLKGYVKDLATFNFAGQDSILVDNLVHNRINLAWYPDETFRGKLEFRNRIFFGDLVQTFADLPFAPDYGTLIDVNNDYFDLSWMPVNNESLVIHTMIDRAYLQWNKNDWEITLGRQRINWGVNLAWNPNDLFNSYSFFDFDYEERPGSDALRVRKYTGFASEVEVAVKAADDLEKLTAAAKWQVNKWGYDIQFLSGVMKNNLAVGGGWAGNIGNAGFKGEFTYLQHLEEAQDGLLISVSGDYSFPNSLYLNGSFLFNSYGRERPDFALVNTSSDLDIRSISPYAWSTFIQGLYPVHPLVNMGLSVIYFPTDQSLFINPYVTYSVISNLDLDLISQLYFSDDIVGNYGAQSKLLYLRLKFSF